MARFKILDFWAPWCAYCSKMDETISELVEIYKDRLELVSINIDSDKEMTSKYHIMGIPTYVIIDDKENTLGRITGYQTKGAMKDFIDSCLK